MLEHSQSEELQPKPDEEGRPSSDSVAPSHNACASSQPANCQPANTQSGTLESAGASLGSPGLGRTEVRQYRFEDLAAGHALVQIELAGTTYVLRRTRSGGLILNK